MRKLYIALCSLLALMLGVVAYAAAEEQEPPSTTEVAAIETDSLDALDQEIDKVEAQRAAEVALYIQAVKQAQAEEAARAEAERQAAAEAAEAARRAEAARQAEQARVQAATPPPAPSGDVWQRLAQCESGMTNANTGNGYYGYFQFALSTWHSVGGTGYPTDHGYGEQLHRAQILQARSGWGQWPACSRKLGLR